MARKVKCAITGEVGTSDTFIKIGNRYYKSQEVYDYVQAQKNKRKEILDIIIYDFMEYEKGMVYPTVVNAKLNELEFYGYDVIKATIDKCYDNIRWVCTHKNFTNDYNKIVYIMAIIKNNINDVYKQFEVEEKITKMENKKVELDVSSEEEMMTIGTSKRGKDISDFLED